MRRLTFFTALLLLSLSSATQFAFGQGFTQAKPWMGIMIETKQNDGVLIKDVVANTPAQKAGLTAGDIVKKIDDVTMKDAGQLISYIQSKGVGNDVRVDYIRAGKNMTLTLKLEAKPDELEMLRKSLVGKPTPAFSLDHVGQIGQFTSKEAAGKVLVIEFWATWCPACRDSHGQLSKFAEENPHIAVLAVSDEELPELKSYHEKVKPKFLNLRDTSREFIKQFLVSAIPMTVVIDQKGTIIFATLGGGAYLQEALVLAKETASKK